MCVLEQCAAARPSGRTLRLSVSSSFIVRPYTLRKDDTLESIAEKRGKDCLPFGAPVDDNLEICGWTKRSVRLHFVE